MNIRNKRKKIEIIEGFIEKEFKGIIYLVL